MATFSKKIITKQIPMCEMHTNLASGSKPALSWQNLGYVPDQDINFNKITDGSF